MINKNLKKSETKVLREQLKNEVDSQLTDIKEILHKRTFNKYKEDLKYTENISSLRKMVRELGLLIESRERTIKQTTLSRSSLKTIRKVNRDIDFNVEQIRNKRIRERNILGGVFRESTFYADEITNLNKDALTAVTDHNSLLSKIFIAKLTQDVKTVNSDSNEKNSLRVYVTIISLVARDVQMPDPEVKGGFKVLEETKNSWFTSSIHTINSVSSIKGFVADVFNTYYESLTQAKEGSEWRFKKFVKFTISINKVKSVFGKSYIKLPDAIARKKACINIKNKDNKCFEWCLIANEFYDGIKSKDKNEVYHYTKHIDAIKRPESIEYPVSTIDIPEYEELNNMQINVFKINDRFTDDMEDVRMCIEEVYKSNQHRMKVVNLLLIEEGETTHYVLIKNLSRLFNSPTTRHIKYFCPNCLNKSYNTADLLEKHVIKCANYSEDEIKSCDVVIECPVSGKNIMKFKNEGNKFKHPFHVIADFESTLIPIEANQLSECKTQQYQKHVQNSFGLKYCCIHKESDKDVELFNSPDPEEVCKQFIEKLESYAKDSYKMTQQHKTTILWEAGQRAHHNASTQCEYCSGVFDGRLFTKVAHHDHITGMFIASLCNSCNLDYQYKKFLPVYLHNLKGYDAHLFINSIHKYGEINGEVSCIPNNEERYISFSKKIKVDEYFCRKTNKMKAITFEIRFLDTIAFMNSSIESLVSNLRKGCNTPRLLRSAFPNSAKHFTDDEQLELMTQKGIYPYDFIDSYDKLNVKTLPSREAFYSKLYGNECSVEDYTQAVAVWEKFNCKTFMDYHNLYLRSDVLLLADVWESFRNTCYTNYKLDCCYYYTAPGLSFDAMLQFTKVELELFTEVEMYEFVESGIRGGLSQISTRHAVANNKYMSNYNKDVQDSYIVYLDANNLYGHAMSQSMPVKNFQWNADAWTKEKIMAIADDADTGYMFAVNLHIPESLHDKFNNYVPCPENIQIDKEDLSAWQQEDYTTSKIRKLCCSFKDKTDYVINYRYLKLVLSLGVELLSVSKTLQYTQQDFLKSYIELNTNLRKKAANDFEKDFFKLMNNSVFGKTMENVRCRINFRLITTEEEAWRVKNLNRFTIFSDNLVGVHIQKKLINLNKPIYLGQTILDESKLLMNNFHYNFMLEKIPREDIDLLFTDTDSLCYHVRKHDVFQLMKDNSSEFDLSDYPVEHELHDTTNKKVIGKFKSESILPITEFVGLRAKLYAYSVDTDTSKHLRCKGVKTGVAKRELNIDHYRNVLYSRGTHSVSQNTIRSYAHQLFTESITKTALSAHDDKVHILDNNVNTLNFGHYRVSTRAGLARKISQ